VFVTVTEDENGSSGSAGSEIIAVTLGIKETTATAPPIKVATPKSMATSRNSRGIRDVVFAALFGGFFGLGNFGRLLDIAVPLNILL
jgi:hypothetical protein